MITRARTRARLAAVVALLIGLGTSAAIVSPAAAEPAPSVVVSPSSDIDPAVETTLTVTGTGFSGAGAANGVYVALGASSVWTPGTVPSASGWVALVWVQPAQLSDGSFSTSLTIAAGSLDAAGSYGVATFAAHELSATDRSLDTFTSIALAAAEPGPEPDPEPEPEPDPEHTAGITVSPATSVTDGTTVTITGTFPATITADAGSSVGTALTTGLYVMYCAEPSGAAGTAGGRASGALCDATKQQYLAASAGPAGATVVGSVDNGWWTFTTTVTVDDAFGTHSCAAVGAEDCGIFVRLYHGFNAGNLSNPYQYDQFVPVTFAAPPTPGITVTPSTDLTGGATVTVTGTLPASITSDVGASSGSALTTGVYVMYCAEPAGQVGTAAGRASGALCDATQQKYLAAASGPAGATVTGTVTNGWWTFETTLTVADAFGTHTCLSDGTEQCGIFLRLYHGFNAGNLSNPYQYDQFVPVTFAAAPATPSTVTLQATPASGAVVGTPVTLTATVTPAVAGSVTFFAGTAQVAVVPTTSGSAQYTYASLPVGDTVLRAVFAPDDPALTLGSEASTTVTVAAPPTPTVAEGSLTWGVKESFRSYVTGPIAQGAITTTGAGTSGGAFVFAQASSSFDGVSGSSNYSGSVRFTGHGGLLDLTLSNPTVRVDSATSGTLYVTVNGGGPIAFATLDLSAGIRSTVGGAAAWSAVPAALTAAGASAFSLSGSNFYAAGTALDPVSFVIGTSGRSASGTQTVLAFAGEREPAATPPSTTGVTVTSGGTVAGGEITISADGFEPNESGILVVIYSDPVVLARDATADASGTVTWSGRLPAGLTGQHTLTLQGSVNRGVVLDLAARVTTASVGCPVDGATLEWGVKESFRSYISGTIANGEWTVADGATYETPTFGWAGGSGSYDAASSEGLVTFPGSITFTGHGGVLNTTLANPQLEFIDADTAILLLDVTGTTQDGEPVSVAGVQFVELDLSDSTELGDGTLTVTDAPATLTPMGAASFGTYAEGEEFDPVSFTLSLDPACVTPAVEVVNAVPPAAPDLGWIWLAVAALVGAGVIVGALLLRRRAQEPGA